MKDFKQKTFSVEKELYETRIQSELNKQNIKTIGDLSKFLCGSGLSKEDCTTLIDKIVGVPNNLKDEVKIEEFSRIYSNSLAELTQQKNET